MPPLVWKNKARLSDLAISREPLAPPAILDLPSALTFSNLAETNAPFAKHMLEDIYAPRRAILAGIDLAALPKGTIVFGGGHFVTSCDDQLIEEQYPPYVGTIVPTIEAITSIQRPIIEISGEKLLIGRFGISTWGHWLGELLPKITLAERAFPGRFSYVLPIHAIDGLRPMTIWSSIRESLEACGIGPSRICAISDDHNYQFENLFAVTPVWADHCFHPSASDSLRKSFSSIEPSGCRRLAISHSPHTGRVLVNAQKVHRFLIEKGFSTFPVGSYTFRQQVSLFKGADSIFGILGSDLTNLVFSPNGVNIITASPDIFGDRFFYALVLDRKGRMADLRGSVIKPAVPSHKGSFEVSLSDLSVAMFCTFKSVDREIDFRAAVISEALSICTLAQYFFAGGTVKSEALAFRRAARSASKVRRQTQRHWSSVK